LAAKIPVEGAIQPFGRVWSIFSSREIQAMIDLAQQHSFFLESNLQIPTYVEKIVNWYERQYTLSAIELRTPSA